MGLYYGLDVAVFGNVRCGDSESNNGGLQPGHNANVCRSSSSSSSSISFSPPLFAAEPLCGCTSSVPGWRNDVKLHGSISLTLVDNMARFEVTFVLTQSN